MPPSPARGGQTAPGAPLARHRPADISRELITLLRTHGLTRLYSSACALLAVISITHSLTVWCDGLHLQWQSNGTTTRWPAHDTHGAAAHLARLAQASQPPREPVR